jgi:hypothetical protein
MTPDELKNYVKKRLKKGYPGGELRYELLQQGYAADAIEQAFSPGRQWNDPVEGFGLRQFQGAAGFLVLGLFRLRIDYYYHFAAGCIVTGIACFLIWLVYWYENR